MDRDGRSGPGGDGLFTATGSLGGAWPPSAAWYGSSDRRRNGRNGSRIVGEGGSCFYLFTASAAVGGAQRRAMHFCGTMSVGTATLKALVTDLCIALTRHGFRKVLLVNHHMDLFHIRALLQAAEEVNRSYAARVVEASSAIFFTGEETAGEREPQGSLHGYEETEIHADVRETSFMLHRHPQLVHPCYRELPPVRIRIAEELRQGPNDRHPGCGSVGRQALRGFIRPFPDRVWRTSPDLPSGGI